MLVPTTPFLVNHFATGVTSVITNRCQVSKIAVSVLLEHLKQAEGKSRATSAPPVDLTLTWVNHNADLAAWARFKAIWVPPSVRSAAPVHTLTLCR